MDNKKFVRCFLHVFYKNRQNKPNSDRISHSDFMTNVVRLSRNIKQMWKKLCVYDRMVLGAVETAPKKGYARQVMRI